MKPNNFIEVLLKSQNLCGSGWFNAGDQTAELKPPATADGSDWSIIYKIIQSC